MPYPLEQLKAAMFSHSRTDTPHAGLLFEIDGQRELKKTWVYECNIEDV